MKPLITLHRSSRSRSTGLAAALVLVTLAAGGCGLRTGDSARSEELLSDVHASMTRCAPERLPPALPGVDEVVDSAMVAGLLRELATDAPGGYVLLSLAFDEEGVGSRRAVIEHSTAPQVADTIQRFMFAARRQVEAADAEWGIRLRLDLGPPARMRVGRREFCPPVARSRDLALAMEGHNPAGIRYRSGVRERVLHMRALVDETGIIRSAHIERGELRGSTLERDIARYLQQFLFAPATVDGFYTSAWVTIPVRVPA